MHVVATAGHVDHGKSTLVLALTGMDPDRFAEEKARGLTIDLGFAWTTLPSGRRLAFVDVPGHVRFLKNMLAGVGGVDACMFVVAATEGWKPQSEEHLRILELLGVGHGLVVLTKVGLVDGETRELARLELEDMVAGTFLEGAEVAEVDVLAGEGVDGLRAALDRLLESTPPAVDRGRPRLWVDRVFAAKGSGTVVTGTLTGGPLAVDDDLVTSPGGRKVRVRGLQSLQEPLRHGGAGEPGGGEPVRRRPRRGRPWPRPAEAGPVAADPCRSTPPSARWGRSATTSPAAAPTRRTWGRASTRSGCASWAATPSGRATRAWSASTCPSPCRCCPETATSCGRAVGTRRSAAGRSSTWRRLCRRPGPARPGRSTGSSPSGAGWPPTTSSG